MRCEVCGRKVRDRSFRVMIEGAKLTVCAECSKLGKIVPEEPLPKPRIERARAVPFTSQARTKRPAEAPSESMVELVENYGAKVRDAREKLGLSHEELGSRLNEKVSVLRKIETGKMAPDNTLASKLEHALKIKLVVPAAEEKERATQPGVARISSEGRTLGDLIRLDGLDGKKKDGMSGRKQS